MADILKDKGNESFKKGEFRKAAKLYRDAIKLDPKNPVYYSNSAMTFIKLEDWNMVLNNTEDGMKLCEEKRQIMNKHDEKLIDDINKTLVKLMYRRATAFMALKEFDNAERMFVKSLKIDPWNLAVKSGYGKLISMKKDIGNKDVSITNEEKQRSDFDKIEIVDVLPDEFYKLVHGKPKEINPQSNKNTVANEKKEIKDIEEDNDLQFPEKPSHYFLVVLMKSMITDNNRRQIYDYVVNKISGQEYKEIFSIAGIDNQFLEFFLQASISLLEQSDINNYGKKIIELMQIFSELERFQLGVMLCDSSLINKLLNLLKSEGYDYNSLKATWT